MVRMFILENVNFESTMIILPGIMLKTGSLKAVAYLYQQFRGGGGLYTKNTLFFPLP